MAMRCFVCGKKLNIFSDYTQIEVNGEKKEICTPCNRKREKEEVKELLKTDKGKKQVKSKGIAFLSTGILEIVIGFFIKDLMPFAGFVIIVVGIYSIYKGASYLLKSKNN